MLQARLELATPALLTRHTAYKYRALTNCATGAMSIHTDYCSSFCYAIVFSNTHHAIVMATEEVMKTVQNFFLFDRERQVCV